MRKISPWIFLLLATIFYPSLGLGHGLGYTVSQDQLYWLQIYFLPQEAASFAEIKVLDSDSKEVLLEGKADYQGRFALPPFQKRIKIEINAGMGHKKILWLDSKQNSSSLIPNSTTSSLLFKVLAGLSLLLNFYLLVKIKNTPTPPKGQA